MTGQELREALTRLGMRTVDAVKLFDVSRTAVEHWLIGRNNVPIRVALILSTLEALSPKDRLAWYTENVGIKVDRKRGPASKKSKAQKIKTGVENGREQETKRL